MTIRVLASVIEFLPVTIQGDPQCLEHEALTWEEEAALPCYALPPGDRRYVEARLGKRRNRGPEDPRSREGMTGVTAGPIPSRTSVLVEKELPGMDGLAVRESKGS